MTDVPLSKQLEINDWTRQNGVYFISASTHGLFGLVCHWYRVISLTDARLSAAFNDFGDKFTCVDPTGEQPLTGMIVSIDKVSIVLDNHCVFYQYRARQDQEGMVTCLDETRHGLEDGQFVTFAEVKGMEALNGCEPRKVTVKGPYTFSIGDTSSLSDYLSGGIFTQVKMPKIVEFVSRPHAPTSLITDYSL